MKAKMKLPDGGGSVMITQIGEIQIELSEGSSALLILENGETQKIQFPTKIYISDTQQQENPT